MKWVELIYLIIWQRIDRAPLLDMYESMNVGVLRDMKATRTLLLCDSLEYYCAPFQTGVFEDIFGVLCHSWIQNEEIDYSP